jgi:MYXO-CTERM domain-containing protein
MAAEEAQLPATATDMGDERDVPPGGGLPAGAPVKQATRQVSEPAREEVREEVREEIRLAMTETKGKRRWRGGTSRVRRLPYPKRRWPVSGQTRKSSREDSSMSGNARPGHNGTSKTRDELTEEMTKTREELGETVQALAGKTDVKSRVKNKAAQTREAVTERFGEQADHAARTAQDKVAQAKEKVTELASRARENATSPEEPNSLVRRSSAAATGLAAVGMVWMWRRRARRNANPWRAAAEEAKAQIKTVRQDAKSGLKTAREHARKQATSQVATARSKARDARAKARSWS